MLDGAFLDRKPAHVRDLLSAEGDEFPEGRKDGRRTGTRSILSVPLLREGESIGALVFRRKEVNPFSEKQIALLQILRGSGGDRHRQCPAVRGGAGPHT